MVLVRGDQKPFQGFDIAWEKPITKPRLDKHRRPEAGGRKHLVAGCVMDKLHVLAIIRPAREIRQSQQNARAMLRKSGWVKQLCLSIRRLILTGKTFIPPASGGNTRMSCW